MEDYLNKYMSNNVLDLPQMINDDFFEAIKLCYNKGYYISAVKLLMSYIDSFSYVVYGKSNGESFQKYLDEYCIIATIGITSMEVWSHRCSILHLTSLDSDKVKSGNVKRLVSYVGKLPKNLKLENDSKTNYFEVMELIKCVSNGTGKYLKEFQDPNFNFEQFVNRYDQIVSDCRNFKVYYKD
jgi:hypothetical protein